MKRRIDKITLLGVLIALGGILGGYYADGGGLEHLWSEAAFLIVIIGSFGAVLVSTPQVDVMRGLRALRTIVAPPVENLEALRDKLLELASVARREGLLALDEYSQSPEADPFVVKCLNAAIDGSSADALRELVETDMTLRTAEMRAASRFWENWGTICPTIGVLGAVLGLIHTMLALTKQGSSSHLNQSLFQGIATAFVATVYGVGFANVVCLPVAFKMRRQIQREQVRMSMVLEGVLGIQAGVAPGALRSRLSVYTAGAADG